MLPRYASVSHPVVLIVVMRGSLVRRRRMRDADGVQAQGGERNTDQGVHREEAFKQSVSHDKAPSLVLGAGRDVRFDGFGVGPRAKDDNPACWYWIYASIEAMTGRC